VKSPERRLWASKREDRRAVSARRSLARLCSLSAGGIGDREGLAERLVPELSAYAAKWCGSCPEFARGSDFLRKLNEGGAAVPGVSYTMLMTRYDELVWPYTSGHLDGATNIVVQDQCRTDFSEHAELAFDPVAHPQAATGRRNEVINQMAIQGIITRAQAQEAAASPLGIVSPLATPANGCIGAGDAAFFCNAIHLLPDKLSAFRLMSTILAPGGIFACNSAFYDGAYVNGTERFYRLWTRRAVGWLHKGHPEVHLSRDGKAMARQWLTPEEYADLLEQGGFNHVDANFQDSIRVFGRAVFLQS